MTEERGLIRRVIAIFDKASGKQMERDFQQSLENAGEIGSREFFKAIKQEFARRQAEIREQLAKGLITREEAARRGREAASAYNRELVRGLEAARKQGKLTNTEFIRLSKTLKDTGDVGVSAFGKMGASIKSMLGPFLGIAAIYKVVDFLRSSVQASNDLEASLRKLSATAKITGTDLAFLQQTAGQANDQFKLGPALANDLTIELAKLSQKAGDVAQAGPGLAAFLDIGAARGLDAQATLKAVQQAILGIDEGTDKLFGKNPSVLYKEFADQFGLVAAKMTDAEKAQALLHAAMQDGDKVRGEYSRWLESTAGQQFLFNQEVLEAKQRVGDELRPVIQEALPSLITLVDAFGRLAVFLAKISATPLDNITKLLELIASPKKALGEELDRMVETWRRRLGMAPGGRAARDQAARNLATWGTDEEARRIAAQNLQNWNRPGAPPPPPPGGGTPGPQPGDPLAAIKVETGIIVPQPTLGTPEMVKANEEAAAKFVGPWERALVDIEQAFYTTGGIISDAAAALAEGGIKGLARYAMSKVKENLAAAIEMAAKALGRLAFGDPAGAAAAAKSAAMHTAAAAAWRVAAAGMGGGGGGGGGVALGIGSAAGSQSAERTHQPAPEVHITFVGAGFDAVNPEVQRVVAGATQAYQERYGGNARVYTYRRSTV